MKIFSFLKREGLRKVPEITAIFWIIKLLTTALGESTSDFLVMRIDPAIAVAIGGVAFILALFLQFYVKKYVPWVYWLAVVMVAVFGTMCADVLHIGLGIPYIFSSAFFALCLLVIFVLWYRFEKTLSIHSINTIERELFYWATVCATFALGTATGDLTATTLKLGYLTSGILFCVLILLPLFAYKFTSVNRVMLFWIAYILTRPLGASFADYFGKPVILSGLGVGDAPVSITLAILICLCVWYSAKMDKQRKLKTR